MQWMCVYFTMHKNGKTKRHYNAVVGVLIYVSSNDIVNCLVRRLYPPSDKRQNSMLPSHINPAYPPPRFSPQPLPFLKSTPFDGVDCEPLIFWKNSIDGRFERIILCIFSTFCVSFSSIHF